jgi:hypothetical protein
MTPEEFRATMQALRWRAADLAAILDGDDRTVQRWYAGSRPVPSNVAVWLRCVNALVQTEPEGWKRQLRAAAPEDVPDPGFPQTNINMRQRKTRTVA